MDQDLYKLMQEILAEKKTEFTKDIEFVGTVTTDEGDINGSKTTVTHDIFRMIDQMPDGSIVQKFYDENKTFIAGRGNDGRMYPANTLVMEDTSLMGQLEVLSQGKGISLNELDTKLEKVAKALGIEKSQILAMSETDLEKKVDEKKKDNPKLTLDEDSKDADKKMLAEQNEEVLANMSSKTQEIDLNQKIDDKHPLYEVMGVPQGSKLIAIYSSAIENNKNTTRFSHVIQYPDGSIHAADMLTQVGGKDSDKNIYETNRDGSEVKELRVQSTYSIKSPIIRNAILTTRIGQMGYLEVGYGQMDRTSHRDAFTQNLEDERTRYTTRAVRDQFSQREGVDNIEDKMDEIKEHEKYGCDDLTLAEADGDKETGHIHIDPIAQKIMDDSAFVESIRDSIGDEATKKRIEAIVTANVAKASIELRGMDNDSIESYAKRLILDQLKDKDQDKNPELENDDFIPSHNHNGV